MDHYAGLDVSLEYSSICVVDANGKVIREGRVASEPEALIAWFGSFANGLIRIGLEAGPLSQWLYAALKEVGLAVEYRALIFWTMFLIVDIAAAGLPDGDAGDSGPC